MDYQQKLQAFQALCQHCLHMREPGDWYVSGAIEIGGDGGILKGEYGNGRTPEEAVLDHWDRLVTHLAPHEYLVVSGTIGPRMYRRWSGFMWDDAQRMRDRHVESLRAKAQGTAAN